ncbi:zinc-ribbon domain-containing protein [Nostoc sp. PA-18-2419]
MPVRTNFCPYCNHQNLLGNKFCSVCGNPVNHVVINNKLSNFPKNY